MSQNPSEKKYDRDVMSGQIPREPRVTGSLAYLSLGFEFLGAFLMFAAFGYFIDYLVSESGRPGLFFIIGLFLGFGGGLWHLIRRTNQLQQWEEEYAAERDRPEARRAAEDIHTQVDRIQRGVDEVHRRLGETFDAPPGRVCFPTHGPGTGDQQPFRGESEPPSGAAS